MGNAAQVVLNFHILNKICYTTLRIMQWRAIPKTRAPWAILIFVTLFVISLVVLIIHEGNDTVFTIWTGLGPFIIVNTSVTYVIVEGGSMIAEMFLKSRYEEGKRQGRKEGRSEGRSEILDLLSEDERRRVIDKLESNRSDDSNPQA